MFISEAWAQAGGAAGQGSMLQAFLPLILIFVVFYFLLIRPQQKKMKQHREMLAAVRRGDKIVTGGGIYGTVTKVENDDELTVEIAKDVKVKVSRATVATVVNRTEPVSGQAANDGGEKSDGILGGLFGGGNKTKENPTLSDARDSDGNQDKDAADTETKKDGDKT